MLKRCCFWEESAADAPRRPQKRKRLDPVIKEAREAEEREWTKKLRLGYLVIRITSNPPALASSNTVTNVIASIGHNHMTAPIPMYVPVGVKAPMTWAHGTQRNIWFSGFRHRSTGCDISFPYDATSALAKEFSQHVRDQLLALEGIENVKTEREKGN